MALPGAAGGELVCQALGRSRRTAEGHDLLAPIYNRLTEGFATHDVKRAKALLAELRA